VRAALVVNSASSLACGFGAQVPGVDDAKTVVVRGRARLPAVP
jgi:hypothetical protein